MRILQIRFRNLNSLVGEWSIDLTQPEFVADGIFAITGPTGAGKSTILDAICLALYGSTPRLGKITRSGNDIMSRHTGECFAEVTFQNPEGRFRCHWSQRRARDKPTGALQAGKHEIADADSGRILAHTLRETGPMIIARTGMSSERFTRSMLLAQGSFAAFLQAEADDRSDILEQITGTAIYTELSRLAHALRAEHDKRLQELMASIGGLFVMDDDTRRVKRQEIETLQEQEKQYDSQVTVCQASLRWHDQVAEQQAHLHDLGVHREALRAEVTAFADDQQRLLLANRALALAAEHARLQEQRNRMQEERTQQARLESSLPALSERVQAAQARVELTRHQLEIAQAQERRQQEPLQRTRALDTEIRRLTAEIDQQAAVLQALVADQDERSAQLREKRQQHQQLSRALEQARQALEAHSVDARVAEQLESLRQAQAALNDDETELTRNRQKHAQARQSAADTRQALHEAEAAVNTLLEERQAQEAHLESLQALLSDSLGKRARSQWRRWQSEQEARHQWLIQACDQLHGLRDVQHRHAEQQARCGELERFLADIDSRLPALQHSAWRLKHEATRDESLFTLTRRVQELEAMRTDLVAGSPCPLCGATEHPVSELETFSLEQARQQRDASKNALDTVQAEQHALQIRQTALQTEQTHARQNLAMQDRATAAHTEALNALAKRLSSSVSIGESSVAALDREALMDEDQVLKALEQAANERDRANDTLQRVEALDAQIESARQAIQAHEHTRHTATATQDRARQAAALAAQAMHDSDEALQQQELRFSRQRHAARQSIAAWFPAADTTPPIDSSKTFQHCLDTLQARAEHWQALQKDVQARQAVVDGLAAELSTAEVRSSERQVVLTQHTQAQEQRHRDRDTVRRERHGLLGDTDPEAEVLRLNTAVDQARKHWQAARDEAAKLDEQMKNTRQRVAELNRSIEARLGARAHAEQAFTRLLGPRGFSNEQAFLDARLSDAERDSLARQSERLNSREAVLTDQLASTTSKLATLQAAPPTEEAREPLQAQLKTLKEAQSDLQQAIGALRNALEDDARRALEHRQQRELIDAQQAVCTRWAALHALIGSADGKKFRNFAQGVTFQIMIEASNQQLRRMSDRYLLTRNDADPLSLNVIDNYQGGEIRPTSNLSGGESFVVSLALALGLSKMSSRKTPVDSLFLDEGFGTLDEQALDTALDTLGSLQQEGKLIGVISHVQALKERISTRIQVEPVSGGRSRLFGPGCRAG